MISKTALDYLNIDSQEKEVPAESHLVFAPLPSATPTLQQAVDVFAQIRQASPCVLFLSDWAARVCNACDADVEANSGYYSILLTSLKSLDSTLMESVTVRLKSEAILTDPSNYWIAVINVGRHFQLDEVTRPSMKDSVGVGAVIADSLSLSPCHGIVRD